MKNEEQIIETWPYYDFVLKYLPLMMVCVELMELGVFIKLEE